METAAILESAIGYLNFSDGTPSPPFQRAANELFRRAIERGADRPCDTVGEMLDQACDEITQFGALNQARSTIAMVHQQLLPAYRRHHADLLAHASDEVLFQPFFLVRCYEMILSLNELRQEPQRLVREALQGLNDFMGHRPVAVLENGRRGLPYPHEKVRPIPIYLRGVGASVGPYQELVESTLEILRGADPHILRDASLSLSSLDELALDPRAYDHRHPVNFRPGYQFGEWDPHVIDQNGRFRRFVVRQEIMVALCEWMSSSTSEAAPFQSAAALAGTMLLASGISGWGPGAHISAMGLAQVVPKVARCRDAFYEAIVEKQTGTLGQELRSEKLHRRQPFGEVRAFLNEYLARVRASQIRNHRLAVIFAVMGFDEASTHYSRQISVPSTRLQAEMACLLAASERKLQAGDVADALAAASASEETLHRAIECGAMIDPWNILGFQGNFSQFQTMEDSVPDPRVNELLFTMRRLFDAYTAVLKESASRNLDGPRAEADQRLARLADWWDGFATVEVSDIPPLPGHVALATGRFAADALADWGRSMDRAGDIAFWRARSLEFRSTSAFGLVLDKLFNGRDFTAAMALLMYWLSEHESVPMEDGVYSLHEMLMRWLWMVLDDAPADGDKLITRFFDHLEANAGTFWNVIDLSERRNGNRPKRNSDEDLYSAAYEGMAYRDSTDDGHDSSVAGNESTASDTIAELSREIAQRLKFTATVSRLWWIVGQRIQSPSPELASRVESWIQQSARNKLASEKVLEQLGAYAIEESNGVAEPVFELERRIDLKEELIAKATAVAIEASEAFRTLLARFQPLGTTEKFVEEAQEPWEAPVIAMEAAWLRGDFNDAKKCRARVLAAFARVPLMYVPMDKGGKAREIFHVRYAREALKTLAVQFACAGDFSGTYDLVAKVRRLENKQINDRPALYVSELDLLFRIAFRSLITQLAARFDTWSQTKANEEKCTDIVLRIVQKFSDLWGQYIASVRVSETEGRGSRAWGKTVRFIAQYGSDLFSPKFLTEGNLRGIIHVGVHQYLERHMERPSGDPEPRVFEAMRAGQIELAEAAEHIEFIVRSILEDYGVYRDYNSTTPQSDYGENLHLVLEFFRVKAAYERHLLAFEPLYIAHNILMRAGRHETASLLRQNFTHATKSTASHLQRYLADVETKCRIRLSTMRDLLADPFQGRFRSDQILAVAEKVAERPPAKRSGIKKLMTLIDEQASKSPGSGIETPEWIERIATAVDQARGSQRVWLLPQEEILLRYRARAPLSYQTFQKQIEGWGEENKS